jgi:tetratricopeptide (TPR) repeat protein
MFERLRSRLKPAGFGPRLMEWTSDRSEAQAQGERLFEQGDYAGAELQLAAAVLDGERRQSPADKRILLRLELAAAQRQQGRHDAAEETIRSALDLANKVGEHNLALQCVNELAAIIADQGNLAGAELVMEEAIRIEGKTKQRDPMMAARRLERLGKLRHGHGKSREAAEALTECVAIHEKVLGPDHLETGRRMSELGRIHHALGNHSETQRYLRRSLKIQEREGGIESAEAAPDVQALTESLEATGDIDGAATILERVLSTKLRAVGANQEEIADMQAALAHHYIGWRRYSRARELLMEAVGSFRRTGGRKLALGYESLAVLEEQAGLYHDAIRELARAGKVWESLEGEHVEDLIQNLEHRAFLFTQLRDDREARYLRDQVAGLRQSVRLTAVG